MSLCMYIIAEFWNLSVFANWTKYFSWSLVSIWWFLLFNGNICFNLGCFVHFFAKSRQRFSRLFDSVSNWRKFNEFVYVLYLSFKIILRADFCTRSRSSMFSWVSDLCQCRAAIQGVCSVQNVSVIAWDYFKFSTDLIQFELFGTYYFVKLISLVLPIQKYFYLSTYLGQKNPLKLPNFDPKWEILTLQLCDSRLELQLPNQSRLMIWIIQWLPQPGYSPHTVSTAAPSGLLIQYNQKYALCYSHQFTIQAGDINCLSYSSIHYYATVTVLGFVIILLTSADNSSSSTNLFTNIVQNHSKEHIKLY